MSALHFAALNLFLSSLHLGAFVSLGDPVDPLESVEAVAVADDSEVPPDVSTYAGIDAALEGRVVMGPHATWRYFLGTENPSLKWEWTKEDFDDTSWSEGAAPFGFGPGHEGLGTTLEGGFSTLYLRRVLTLPDRSTFARVLLELPIDDGYVLYVNGREEDRQHADKVDTYHAFDSTTTGARTVDTPPVPTIKLTRAVRDGENTLAIQVLTHTTSRDSLAAHPRLRVVFHVTEAGEKARLLELRGLLGAEGEGAEARLSYLEGRHLQRMQRHADAIASFERVTALDASAGAPWQRLIEAHRSVGTLAVLDAAMLDRLGAGNHTPAMLDAWAGFALEDLSMSPVEFAARVSSGDHGSTALPQDGLFAEALWSGAALAAGHSLLIDCGATSTKATLEASNGGGTAWGKDRCFGEGTKVAVLAGGTPGGRVRVCSRSLDVLVPAYRIPLATGAYQVVLHFAPSDGEERAAGDAVFDVSIEDARVARGVDPVAIGAPSSLRFPVFVRDGFLDVDLLPQTGVDPWLAGLEVHPLSAGDPALAAAVGDWVRATEQRETFPLAQLAEVALAAGDPKAAFAALEEAESLPDFDPVSRARLAHVRDLLLPEILSFASIDDLVERRPQEAESILEAVRAAGQSDEFVPYFAGRLHQLANRPDDAIIDFEELVFGDGKDPRPVQRMVEGLASANLAQDAFTILSEALENGVEPTPELLQLWISLQLGPLARDPWQVIDDLSTLDVPDELVVVPTSEFAARTWRITNFEPPAIAWSRPEFDDSPWDEGPGMIGSGHTMFGTARSHSNKEMVFGRMAFTLLNGSLLYPYFDVYGNDAAECYLNGTLVSRISVSTDGYVDMPVRPAPFLAGKNVLGEFGFNIRDESLVDAGIMQPLDELMWIKRQLDEKAALRINCGGGDLLTPDGKKWSRDRFFGWAKAAPEADAELDIAGTEHDALYRTNRWFYDDAPGAFHQIPLPDGDYHVTLHFAEIDEKYRNRDPDASESVRSFDVRLEKELVLEALDVVAEVGFATALVREFDIEITDGWFDLLINDVDHRSFISAFEIEMAAGN